jgi:YbbR domain-containing protein
MRHALGASVGVTAGVGDPVTKVGCGVPITSLVGKVVETTVEPATVTVQVGLEEMGKDSPVGVRVTGNEV